MRKRKRTKAQTNKYYLRVQAYAILGYALSLLLRELLGAKFTFFAGVMLAVLWFLAWDNNSIRLFREKHGLTKD